MSALFKDLTAGATVYALIKGEELKYMEGSVVSIGLQRMDMPQIPTGQMPLSVPQVKNVVDVTYTIDGKNYTDAVDVALGMFPTNKTGFPTLVSTDKADIVKELHATLKNSENYLQEAEKQIPKERKRIKECKTLISQLDTVFQEKQHTEERFAKIEKAQEEQGGKLDKILALLEKQ